MQKMLICLVGGGATRAQLQGLVPALIMLVASDAERKLIVNDFHVGDLLWRPQPLEMCPKQTHVNCLPSRLIPVLSFLDVLLQVMTIHMKLNAFIVLTCQPDFKDQDQEWLFWTVIGVPVRFQFSAKPYQVSRESESMLNEPPVGGSCMTWWNLDIPSPI